MVSYFYMKKQCLNSSDVFYRIFGLHIQNSATANARVNLMGEHTDYNSGLVLPVLLELKTTVYGALQSNLSHDTVAVLSNYADRGARSILNAKPFTRSLGEKKQGHWTDYIVGTLREIKKYRRTSLPGLCFYIDSNIPSGAGISSSAALEIAIVRTVNALLQTNIGDLTAAKLARRAENEYIGMPCGLMDQMVISMGMEETAMLIDFFNEEQPSYDFAPLFKHITFLLISSGIFHKLGSGDEGYRTRFEQCKLACKRLDVPNLSVLSVSDLENLSLGDELLQRRVRHVVCENQRVRDARKALLTSDPKRFAILMNESHASQRDLYHTSIPEINALCDSALKAGALGARLTGGGFGGSIVAMVETHKKEEALQGILSTDAQAKFLAEIARKAA